MSTAFPRRDASLSPRCWPLSRSAPRRVLQHTSSRWLTSHFVFRPCDLILKHMAVCFTPAFILIPAGQTIAPAQIGLLTAYFLASFLVRANLSPRRLLESRLTEQSLLAGRSSSEFRSASTVWPACCLSSKRRQHFLTSKPRGRRPRMRSAKRAGQRSPSSRPGPRVRRHRAFPTRSRGSRLPTQLRPRWSASLQRATGLDASRTQLSSMCSLGPAATRLLLAITPRRPTSA